MVKKIKDWSIDQLSKKRLNFKDLAQSQFSTEFIRLSAVLNSTIARQILWHVINQSDNIPRCKCGKSLSWNADKHQYRDFCSKKCTAIYTQEKIKDTCIQKYGVPHFSQTESFTDKIKSTSIKKFGVTHYSKTKEFKTRTKDTNQQKFKVNYPAQSKVIQQKMKETCIKNFGVENPMQSDIVKEKLFKTNLEKYGVKNPLKSTEVKNKVKKTMIQKYGVSNPAQNKTIRDKITESKKRKYYSSEVYSLLHDPLWLESQNKHGKSVGAISQELGVSSSNLCKYFNKYGIEITKHFRSAMEEDLCKKLADLGIDYKCNVRNVISPYEIDIWLPNFNIGIELNGAYYHSESHGKDSTYHLTKTLISESKSIILLQFFDWEVFNNIDIIMDKILHLTQHNKKVGARTLEIRVIENSLANQFYQENHLQGPCASRTSIGLFDKNDTLLSAASFGKSRYSKKYDHELLRFACKNNFAVIGSASKLLTYFIKNHALSGQTVVSYCNRRWSVGNLYNKLGFTLLHTSSPGYYYITKNGEFAGTRQQWQKHLLSKKLKIFDSSLTEWQNMQANGYSRIWDCGQFVYIMKI